MTKPWTEALKPSEVQFMNSIVEQVPEAMGARAAFVACLQNLADAAAPPKFRYIVATEGDVLGTNDLEKAREQAVDETYYVIDTVATKWLCTGDEDDDTDIVELT